MNVLLFSIGLLYALLVVALYVGWKFTPIFPSPNGFSQKHACVSIIVAMRNEEKNIGNLLTCLMHQQFTGQMEVILVDDASEDSSVAVANSFTAIFPCPLVVIPSEGVGKKAAIATGVRHARFPLILTTDADCQMGCHWVETMVDALEQSGVKLITGIVAIEPTRDWLARFQAIETAALLGSTAAFIAWNMPIMGNGANMGYWKEVFEQTGGYASSAEIASGDDEFLIQQVHNHFRGSIKFVKHPEAIVLTSPQSSWQAVFMQRKRWAAKWRKKRPFRVWATALLIGCFHLFWAAIPIFTILFPTANILTIFAILMLKLATEYLFLTAILKFTRQQKLLPYIGLLQLVYSHYAIWVGLHSLAGGYSWKGRYFVR
ncbi:MAG: glycosyltransferase [Cytophagales bacterium]|nr:glycosyltransferase [Bernardetiaceae bacterium]MDW8211048.1 glycosyltransferase [Cytophagales bacterium]